MKSVQIVRHNSYFHLVLTSAVFLLLTSCMLPSNKKAYINKFEKFVERVEKEGGNYNQQDWKWADTQFEKFRTEWYDIYREELSLKEKMHIQTLVIRYETLKGREKAEKRIREYLKEDAKELKEKVEEYLRQDADEDLEKLKEGMKEIGDSATKVFEDIVRSLEKKLDN